MTVTFWEDAATGAEARTCKAGVAEGRGLTDPRVRLSRLAVLAFLPLRDMDNPRILLVMYGPAADVKEKSFV
jgi:hypothetical protein